MRKFFLFALLVAATSLFAETRVETFDTKDGSVSNTYVTTVTTKECQQASWTFFSGGILKNLGDMGSTNFAAVIRAKKSTEDVYPYIESSTIEGGVDSLWFTWNSNGNETNGTWNVVIYINGDSVGAITGAGGPKAASPFNKYGIGHLGITGDFTIKFVNESPYDGTGNSMRFVFDDLSWEPKKAAGEKEKPTFEFAEENVLKVIGAERFTNPLTNTSDATPVFVSSDPYTARVDQNGEVTITKVGTATITATIDETETYKAATASYTIRIVPENFKMETFDGAVNATGNATYHQVDSVTPVSNAGIIWTTLLGSVRDNLGQSGTQNIAAVIRGKKTAEANYAYLASNTIAGGIDSLAFDWNSNGDESSRTNPWNIEIYINDEKVGTIAEACTAVKPMGSWNRYALGNLKVEGDFTIKFVNKNEADNGTGNQYRFVLDNLEWYSYEKPCSNDFGIILEDETYIAGEYNAEQTEWLEYKIVAELEAKQTFKFYNNCAKEAFLPNGQDDKGTEFNVEGDVWKAPWKGTYTIYLKMYGYNNNWTYTEYEAPFYTVTITEPTNGTLVVMDGAFEVKTGGKVQVNKVLQIIPTPAEGYQVASVTANGDKIEPQEGGYYYMMSYVDVTIAATFEEACAEDFGIMVDGEKYIAGVKNVEQTGWKEYIIVAELEKDQTLKLYDNCSKAGFLATQQEGGYWFTVGDGVWIAPAKGEYTICLKMYGYDNNVIWTAYKDTTTGIENAALKAGVRKAVENGVVVIYRNGVRYNLQGQNF